MLTHLIISTLIMGLLLGYYLLQLKKRSWFQLNRFYLLGILPFALWLPTFQFSLPINMTFSTTQELVELYVPIVEITSVSVGPGKDWTVSEYALLIYLTGVLVYAGRMFTNFFKLNGLRKEYTLQQSNPFYQLFLTGGDIPTSSFMRNIYWDETADLTPEEEAQVMAHEMAHIKFKHSWDIILIEVMKVVLWFHPLVYRVDKELKLVHEFQADEAAFRRTSPAAYARLILKKAYSATLSLGHAFFETPAVSRIKMLGKNSSRLSLLSAYTPLIPIVLGVITVCGFENVEIQDKIFPPTGEKIVLADTEIPDISSYVSVEEEPIPLNIADIQRSIGYPATAREEGIDGTVVVRVLVDINGHYREHVVLTEVSPLLTGPVEREISNLRFTPAIQDGHPVNFWVNIPFNFKLL
ncbi:MAG: M56 family metallopeptidase, partial [Bacteroidota bacterium]